MNLAASLVPELAETGSQLEKLMLIPGAISKANLPRNPLSFALEAKRLSTLALLWLQKRKA